MRRASSVRVWRRFWPPNPSSQLPAVMARASRIAVFPVAFSPIKTLNCGWKSKVRSVKQRKFRNSRRSIRMVVRGSRVPDSYWDARGAVEQVGYLPDESAEIVLEHQQVTLT